MDDGEGISAGVAYLQFLNATEKSSPVQYAAGGCDVEHETDLGNGT